MTVASGLHVCALLRLAMRTKLPIKANKINVPTRRVNMSLSRLLVLLSRKMMFNTRAVLSGSFLQKDHFELGVGLLWDLMKSHPIINISKDDVRQPCGWPMMFVSSRVTPEPVHRCWAVGVSFARICNHRHFHFNFGSQEGTDLLFVLIVNFEGLSVTNHN